MTTEQLIEAMSLLGHEKDVDYTIDQTYDSIVMLSEDLEKPEESQLQEVYDFEQARLAEEARLSEVQDRIDAIPDLVLAIDAYIKGSPYPGEEGAFNMAGFRTAKRLESDFGWDFPNKPKPTIDDLESVATSAKEEADLSQLRRERDRKIEETIWMFQRHQREESLGVQTTLTSQKLDEWLQYWQDLADLPENVVDPSNPEWPEKPE